MGYIHNICIYYILYIYIYTHIYILQNLNWSSIFTVPIGTSSLGIAGGGGGGGGGGGATGGGEVPFSTGKEDAHALTCACSDIRGCSDMRMRMLCHMM
jgi:hypothetical protein